MVAESMIGEELGRRVRGLLGESSDEWMAIALAFGISDGRRRFLSEVAGDLGVSVRRVRKLVGRALERLRSAGLEDLAEELG
jgi:DNA-directed RNA polymerase sigma subunit (sigma70/sigma32)